MAREIAYRTLASKLRTALVAGEFDEHRPVPTEDELSSTYAVSRHTVRRAMQDLVAEGLIYRVAGRGTFPVLDQGRYIRQLGSIEDLMALSDDTECEIVAPLGVRIDIEGASRLRLSSDSVIKLTLRRLHRDTPFCVTTVTLPPRIGSLLEGIPELTCGRRSRVTVIELIDDRLPRRITGAEQSITAIMAPTWVTPHLDAGAEGALLRVDRLYLDARGEPVELAVSYFDPRHYSYRINLRRRPP
jgi:GntR family transcriptional regulator